MNAITNSPQSSEKVRIQRSTDLCRNHPQTSVAKQKQDWAQFYDSSQ